jgi:hypothetical protein
MPKLVFALLLLFNLSACGFQVIYKERDQNSEISYVEELAAIRIQKDRKRVSQELKNNLYDLLNPDYLKSEPKYFLILDLKESISPTFITLTGASGRNKLVLQVSYTLKSLETGDIISSGNTIVNDDYDVSDSRYGTFAAENYIKSNMTKTIAQNIRNSLVNDLIEMKKGNLKKKSE